MNDFDLDQSGTSHTCIILLALQRKPVQFSTLMFAALLMFVEVESHHLSPLDVHLYPGHLVLSLSSSVNEQCLQSDY